MLNKDSTNPERTPSSNELDVKAVKVEPDFPRRHLQRNEDTNLDLSRHDESRRLNTRYATASALDQAQTTVDDSGFCSTSSIRPAPVCRQFWKAGNYDDVLHLKPPSQNGTGYLRIHPKFLHSNATSHKWAFGAMAELLDNSVDEIKNGATIVMVDKTSNPRDGNPALTVQDDGGGMDPEAMRRCLSFGFSDKKSKDAIGLYGNGFKTSSMRLGADVVVFSRCQSCRRLTQSIGLLSYTFLMQTRQDRIVVPIVDYVFDTGSRTWRTLHNEQQLKNNLSILLKWSPVTTEAELLKHCDDIGPHGTKIIIYNLWHNDDGKMELDFDSDADDIRLCGKDDNAAKVALRKETNEHLANRLHFSLRAYLSILYLRAPQNFCILLRGRVVEYHNIANDLKYPEFILYRPLKVEGSVVTTIGFLKEAPAVNIHGFNVYHKNRLILPFWHVVTYGGSRGRGVVGVLEANFIEPTHNKQEFEKTPVFQKLETRLKEMALEYWDYHCGLIGYYQYKAPGLNKIPNASPNSRLGHNIYQPVVLGKDAAAKTSFDKSDPSKSGRSLVSDPQNFPGAAFKRQTPHDHVADPERVKRVGVVGSWKPNTVSCVNQAGDPPKQWEEQEVAKIIQENQNLHALCQMFEKTNEELDFKMARLMEELREAQLEYASVLPDKKLWERVKGEIRETKPA